MFGHAPRFLPSFLLCGDVRSHFHVGRDFGSTPLLVTRFPSVSRVVDDEIEANLDEVCAAPGSRLLCPDDPGPRATTQNR